MDCDQLILTGDFNINMLQLDSAHVKQFTDILISYSLTQLVNFPTRITSTSATLIDLIVCCKNAKISKTDVNPNVHIADHFWIDCHLDLYTEENETNFIYFRDLKNINLDYFNLDLNSIPFHKIYYVPGINNKLELFNSYILQLFEKHAPIQQRVVKKKRKPWITHAIISMRNVRDKYLRKYKKSKTDKDWELYKEWRNYYNESLVREQKAYINSRLAVGSNKDRWHNLKKIGVSKPYKASLPKHLSDPDKINNYFSSVLSSNQNPSSEIFGKYRNSKHERATDFSFKMTTETEVANLLSKIKSKSLGVDGIGIDMLILCCPTILPVITHLINVCIETNTFPDIWKIAYITPVPKCNMPRDLKDLRPISILPTLSKIAEKILGTQLQTYLDNNSLLPSVQSGFRSGHSCATALLKITDDILQATDNDEVTALVLLDYSKAFDKINHSLLLAILEHIGCSRESIFIVESYLQGREQMVKVKDKVSVPAHITCGVPQGSILGPLLFCIYTSQLCTCLKSCKSHLYADDIQLYFSFPSADWHNASMKINSDLNALSCMSREHCLELNPNKCAVMFFGREKSRSDVINNDNFPVRIHDKLLPVVESIKNLGVELDTSLRFSNHINKIINKAFGCLKLIYSYRKVLNEDLKKLLCDALVLSQFNYCDVLYNSCLNNRDSSRIQILQNSCVRLICGIPRRQHLSHKYVELNWMNMSQRRILHCLVLYHKIMQNMKPGYLYEKVVFRSDVHDVNVRNKNLISPPIHNTSIFKRSFSYSIYKLYNRVPCDVKSTSASSFKEKCKALILSSYFS
nr:unnamed protein product [Callosobruchus chinensis]